MLLTTVKANAPMAYAIGVSGFGRVLSLISLTSDMGSNSVTYCELGPVTQRNMVRQVLQGLSCGAGFKF